MAETVEDAVEGTRSAYEQIAETYAEVNRELPNDLLRLAHKLAHHMGEDAHIVDVGCGAGRAMRWFEGQGMRVTGVDLSSAMLGQARGVTAGALLRMDMRHPAIRSALFDGAWCAASLLHLPKREAPRALAEIRRIVKRGGVLMVSVKQGDGEAWAGGYVEGVKRFYAYYRHAEIGAILAGAGIAVSESSEWSSRASDWLSFLCVAT